MTRSIFSVSAHSLLALLVGGWLFASAVHATPPERPVDIELVSAESLADLRAEGDRFAVGVSFAVNAKRDEVHLFTQVFTTDGVVPETAAEERTPIRAPQMQQDDQRTTGRVDAEIPVLRDPGVFRVEIAARDGDGAIYDRIVLMQVVDDRGARLYTQAQWREERKRRRKNAFEESRSVRALAGRLRVLGEGELERHPVQAPDQKDLQVRADADLGGDAPFVRDVSHRAWTKVDPVTYRGRIVYTDFEGTVRPLHNAGVYLYDDDTFGDDFLGSVATDGNGRFSFTVNNDDGWLQNGRDLYIKLKLRNTRWRVHDGGDYEWATDPSNDLNEGAVVDIGTVTPDDDMAAVQIFGFINRAWLHVTAVAGRDPGFVNVDYPGGGDFFDGEVNVSAASNRAPDIVIHEYGHFLMEAAYPGGDPSPGGAHNFGETSQDERLSWSEGWATGFMLSHCNDGQYNWDEGTTEGAGEWPACRNQNDPGGRELELYSNSGNRLGEEQEGRVAAALLDLMDRADDDNGGSENRGRNGEEDENASNRVGLDTLYNDVMWSSGHNDVIDFWYALNGELSGATRSDAREIMRYNWMSVPGAIEICVASRVATEDFEDAADQLDGLRAFRDEGLKPLVRGRQLMQLYYRHSPELATLLMEDRGARAAAGEIVRHFAGLGRAALNHAVLEKYIRANEPLMPDNVKAAADRIFELIDAQGSEALRDDAAVVEAQLRRYGSLPLHQVMAIAEREAEAGAKDAGPAVDPLDFAPASRDVDWDRIREFIGVRK